MRSKRLLKVIFSVIIVIALSATMLSVVLLRLKNTNDEKSVDNTVTEKGEFPIKTEPVETITHSDSEATAHSDSKLSEEQKEWLKDTAKQIGQEQVAQGLGSPKARQQLPQDYVDSQLHRGNYTGNDQAEFDSNSDVPTYSINYILGHYKELDGKEVRTEGFYSFDSYLFEHSYQVQNDPAIGVDDGIAQAYIHTAYVLGANKTGIQMVSHKVDINPSALTVGDEIAVTGICHTQETNNGTLGYVIIELESLEIKESTFDHTPPIQIYTPDYVVKHYEELEGKEIIIEGYVSSKTINNNGITSIHVVNEASDVLGYEVDANNGDLFTLLKIVAEEAEQSIAVSLSEDQNTNDLHPGDKLLINTIIEILHGKQDGVAYTKPSFTIKGIEKIT